MRGLEIMPLCISIYKNVRRHMRGLEMTQAGWRHGRHVRRHMRGLESERKCRKDT